ncbi:hypothetical protein C1637_11445 [Chryseobacterium lactis]|uniref:Lipoprotein n=1 Tax=Chryseobacterium lactis TaxID=1241981 RepID=A0A3G6RRG4_CHRLC|nr:hypothetical protein [Chryseobacterium lactis]AZA80847.1 hypothetical protein EG342_02495 [Chryseobacterium lactis]AZB05849.1 hypothetical protein EG341_18620 [Chryseobacterium lactis]PNW13431.1 hypothetical protein C1637_11445 [Chryseobacterium lactis]
MKKQFLMMILSAFCFLNCNPLYRQYKDLTLVNQQKKFSHITKSQVKKILSKYNKKQSLFIISWENNIFNKKKLVFNAIMYDNESKNIEYIYNNSEKQDEIIFSNQNPSNKFNSELFILDNYIRGKEDYLLSLHDSFSSSEIGSYFYLYDFTKNKRLKISAIAFDENDKLIQ